MCIAMVRRQIHLTEHNLRKLAELQARHDGVSSAEIIRRAIEAYEPDEADASSTEQREQAAAVVEALREGLSTLAAELNASIEGVRAARTRIRDPQWIEAIRERTRREAETDPALVAGVARLIGAGS